MTPARAESAVRPPSGDVDLDGADAACRHEQAPCRRARPQFDTKLAAKAGKPVDISATAGQRLVKARGFERRLQQRSDEINPDRSEEIHRVRDIVHQQAA